MCWLSGGLQEAQKQYLERDLSEGLLCAVINNNTRCYNESTEFADHLDDELAGPFKVRHTPLVCSSSDTFRQLVCMLSNASEAHGQVEAGVICTAGERVPRNCGRSHALG